MAVMNNVSDVRCSKISNQL